MAWNIAIKWIMLVSGGLTLTMVYAAVAPEAAMRSTFGEYLGTAGLAIGIDLVTVGLFAAYLLSNRPEKRHDVVASSL